MPGVGGKGGQPDRLRRRWQDRLGDHVIALAWSPTGTRLAAAQVSGPVRVYDARTGAVMLRLPGHDLGTTDLGFSHDGAHVATCGQDGKVKFWDLKTGQEKNAVTGGDTWVEHLAWSPTEILLASAAGKRLRLWDAEGRPIRDYSDHTSTISDVQWRSKTRMISTTSYGSLTLWDVDRNDPAQRFEWKGSILVHAWSPNGQFVATGDQDATVHFWFATTGQDLQMWGYRTKVRELSWDATSRYLATGGGLVITIWDCGGQGPEGTTPLQLEGHEDSLTAVAFQHAGPLLASAGTDGCVAVWQPPKSIRPVAFVQLDSEATQIAWSPDDNLLAVGTDAGDVGVLALPA
ncbi:MAG TPA: WD40 repeat domain-containing protein [Gemmataceae bacterium]|nr:WD40 repeat domain-containing protein [Gemmataceae bacterium]